MKKALPILLVFIVLLVFVAGYFATSSVANAVPIVEAPAQECDYRDFSEDPVEEGITLSKCLTYDNARWQEIEDLFIKNVLSNIPYKHKIYDSSELSTEILEARNGEVIVERCVGFVTNKTTGDGKLLNPYNKDSNYIAYRSVTDQTYCDGTVFISYMLYNYENNYTDDIIERYDFVLCREWED